MCERCERNTREGKDPVAPVAVPKPLALFFIPTDPKSLLLAYLAAIERQNERRAELGAPHRVPSRN